MLLPQNPAEEVAYVELLAWQKQMQYPPSRLAKFTRRVQLRLNGLLPERVHQAITGTIKQLVRGVLFGSTHLTRRLPRWPPARPPCATTCVTTASWPPPKAP